METEMISRILEEQSKRKPQNNFSSLGDYLPTNLPQEFEYIKQQERTYSDIGFNNFMERIKPAQFSQLIESSDLINIIDRGGISSDKIGTIASSNILQAVNDLVKLADTNSISTSLGSGSRATLTSTLTDNQDPNRILLAVFFVTAYQTSITGVNAIPYGASVTAADWDIYYAHDWGTNNNRYASGVHSVANLSGSTKTVLWDLHWRFIGGTAS